MNLTDLKNKFRNKKILILGMGREGMDSFLFFRKLFPDKVLGLADKSNFEKLDLKTKKALKKDKRIKIYFGKDYLLSIFDYDTVLKTPGIPYDLPEIAGAEEKKKITSQTEIFLEYCQGRVIGITGTKGKSTTASLIYDILKQAGVRTYLIGNIGKPVLSFLLSGNKNDVFVYEMSCHQLCGIKKSPQIAVLLNIFKEHLDYYKTFEKYQKAKENIFRYQKKDDFLVVNYDQKSLREIAKKAIAKKVFFSIEKKISHLIFFGAFLKKHYIYFVNSKRKKEKIIKITEIPLRGRFNLLNVAAAVSVAGILNIRAKDVRRAIRNFKPLACRLEFVGGFKNIEFYNDSLSTIPETAIAAIDAMEGKVDTLIMGGFDRGQDFKKLAMKILKSRARNLILLPETGDRISREIFVFRKRDSLKVFFVFSMRDAVKVAFKITGNKGVCLLSPASPSFGMFKDYQERGNLFKKYIKAFSK